MSFSTRVMRPEDWLRVAPYFTPAEFGHPEKMGWEFIEWLVAVRLRAGVPMVRSSDWRDPAANVAAGGARDSAHSDVPCNAADFRQPRRVDPTDPNWNRARYHIITAALSLGCTRIGIYPNGSIHLDRTEDRRPTPRLWPIVDNPAP